MKEEMKKSVETEENTNLFPIDPDLDACIDPAAMKDGKVSDCELAQEVETINPDPDSLDRG